MKGTIIAALVIGAVTVAGVAVAHEEGTPSQEAWPADVPTPSEPIGVVDEDGNLIECPQDGQMLTVEVDDPVPPNLGQEERTNDGTYRVTEGVVPRCGPTGGGANGEAIWVPESVGDDTATAPPSYVEAQTP